MGKCASRPRSFHSRVKTLPAPRSANDGSEREPLVATGSETEVATSPTSIKQAGVLQEDSFETRAFTKDLKESVNDAKDDHLPHFPVLDSQGNPLNEESNAETEKPVNIKGSSLVNAFITSQPTSVSVTESRAEGQSLLLSENQEKVNQTKSEIDEREGDVEIDDGATPKVLAMENKASPLHTSTRESSSEIDLAVETPLHEASLVAEKEKPEDIKSSALVNDFIPSQASSVSVTELRAEGQLYPLSDNRGEANLIKTEIYEREGDVEIDNGVAPKALAMENETSPLHTSTRQSTYEKELTAVESPLHEASLVVEKEKPEDIKDSALVNAFITSQSSVSVTESRAEGKLLPLLENQEELDPLKTAIDVRERDVEINDGVASKALLMENEVCPLQTSTQEKELTAVEEAPLLHQTTLEEVLSSKEEILQASVSVVEETVANNSPLDKESKNKEVDNSLLSTKDTGSWLDGILAESEKSVSAVQETMVDNSSIDREGLQNEEVDNTLVSTEDARDELDRNLAETKEPVSAVEETRTVDVTINREELENKEVDISLVSTENAGNGVHGILAEMKDSVSAAEETMADNSPISREGLNDEEVDNNSLVSTEDGRNEIDGNLTEMKAKFPSEQEEWEDVESILSTAVEPDTDTDPQDALAEVSEPSAYDALVSTLSAGSDSLCKGEIEEEVKGDDDDCRFNSDMQLPSLSVRIEETQETSSETEEVTFAERENVSEVAWEQREVTNVELKADGIIEEIDEKALPEVENVSEVVEEQRGIDLSQPEDSSYTDSVSEQREVGYVELKTDVNIEETQEPSLETEEKPSAEMENVPMMLAEQRGIDLSQPEDSSYTGSESEQREVSNSDLKTDVNIEESSPAPSDARVDKTEKETFVEMENLSEVVGEEREVNNVESKTDGIIEETQEPTQESFPAPLDARVDKTEKEAFVEMENLSEVVGEEREDNNVESKTDGIIEETQEPSLASSDAGINETEEKALAGMENVSEAVGDERVVNNLELKTEGSIQETRETSAPLDVGVEETEKEVILEMESVSEAVGEEIEVDIVELKTDGSIKETQESSLTLSDAGADETEEKSLAEMENVSKVVGEEREVNNVELKTDGIIEETLEPSLDPSDAGVDETEKEGFVEMENESKVVEEQREIGDIELKTDGITKETQESSIPMDVGVDEIEKEAIAEVETVSEVVGEEREVNTVELKTDESIEETQESSLTTPDAIEKTEKDVFAETENVSEVVEEQIEVNTVELKTDASIKDIQKPSAPLDVVVDETEKKALAEVENISKVVGGEREVNNVELKKDENIEEIQESLDSSDAGIKETEEKALAEMENVSKVVADEREVNNVELKTEGSIKETQEPSLAPSDAGVNETEEEAFTEMESVSEVVGEEREVSNVELKTDENIKERQEPSLAPLDVEVGEAEEKALAELENEPKVELEQREVNNVQLKTDKETGDLSVDLKPDEEANLAMPEKEIRNKPSIVPVLDIDLSQSKDSSYVGSVMEQRVVNNIEETQEPITDSKEVNVEKKTEADHSIDMAGEEAEQTEKLVELSMESSKEAVMSDMKVKEIVGSEMEGDLNLSLEAPTFVVNGKSVGETEEKAPLMLPKVECNEGELNRKDSETVNETEKQSILEGKLLSATVDGNSTEVVGEKEKSTSD